MLNLILIILIIVLIFPQPLSKTIKKIGPFIAIFCIIGLIAFIIQRTRDDRVIGDLVIEALNEKNSKSEGKEVWLMSLTVNGEEVRPEKFFDNQWICQNEALIWRPYDQKEGMGNAITAEFEAGTQIEMKFQQNQWRGKARISYGGQTEVLDFYKNTKSSDQMISYRLTVPEVTQMVVPHVSANIVVICVLTILIVINLIFFVFMHRNKKNITFLPAISEKREVWMDCLKVVASFMIVLIHSSGWVYSNFFEQGSSLWLKTLWINAIPRFAVPCFLMITGVLLLSKEYDFDKKLYKKISRILIPLFFWSVVYVFTRKLLWRGQEDIVKELLKIPFQKQDGSLWYAYQLIWLYLGMPFWQRLYAQLTIRLRWYFVLFSLGIPGILTLLGEVSMLNVPDYLPFTSIIAMVCYVGVLFLGRLLYDVCLESGKIRSFITGLIATLFGLGMMVGCSIFVSYEKGEAVNAFFSEVSLPTIFYACGIFLVFGSMREWILRWPIIIQQITCRLSSVALGVYMSHCLVIWIFPTITVGGVFLEKNGGSIRTLLICVMIYYLIDLLGCLLASNLPVLKRLVL